METVEVDEEDAEVVLAEKITGRDLLTTSDLDRLLESVKLKAGPRSRIAEKIKELKGDLRSCCLLAVLLVVSLFLKGRCLAVVARPPRLARFISDGFSLSALPCSDVSTARKQALAAAAATGRPADPPVISGAPAAGTPFCCHCLLCSLHSGRVYLWLSLRSTFSLANFLSIYPPLTGTLRRLVPRVFIIASHRECVFVC